MSYQVVDIIGVQWCVYIYRVSRHWHRYVNNIYIYIYVDVDRDIDLDFDIDVDIYIVIVILR
jgi:hypothetical protein